MKLIKTFGVAAAFGIAALATAPMASAQEVSIKAVGTWGNLTNYTKHEGPFWSGGVATQPAARSRARSNHRPS